MTKALQIILVVLPVILACSLKTAAQAEGYFIGFTDKHNNPYDLSYPQAYLSDRAIERRNRQNIAITEQDLPVSPAYVDSLKKLGMQIKYTTKWLNGAIVFSSNSQLMDTLHRVSFIAIVEKTKSNIASKARRNKFESSHISNRETSDSQYGEAWDQIRTVKGQALHEKGFSGDGIHIAVIDAGFYNVDVLPAFQHLFENDRVLGIKDFVDPTSNIYQQNSHGMKVLSIIGGKMDNGFTGTAPEASFWLLRSEDEASEYPIEADYWICAAEFADSAGVDVINTSLGYSLFDDASLNYSYNDLDGSSRISRAAKIAASKGMIIVNSAGNEGALAWHYITTPADAKDIISVGAMSIDSTNAYFSSYGPTFDGRPKPEITAMGVNVATQGVSGGVVRGSGTSFSSPVIAGLAACLWQSLPNKNAVEIRDIIIKSATQYLNPDDAFGYGIPNFDIAYRTDVNDQLPGQKTWKVTPNPFKDQLRIIPPHPFTGQSVSVTLYDVLGQRHAKHSFSTGETLILNNLQHLAKGMYILVLEYNGKKHHFKVLKKDL